MGKDGTTKVYRALGADLRGLRGPTRDICQNSLASIPYSHSPAAIVAFRPSNTRTTKRVTNRMADSLVSDVLECLRAQAFRQLRQIQTLRRDGTALRIGC